MKSIIKNLQQEKSPQSVKVKVQKQKDLFVITAGPIRRFLYCFTSYSLFREIRGEVTINYLGT